MSKFKQEKLERGDIISIVGAGQTSYGLYRHILPIFKGGHDNVTVDSGAGEYDGGDRVIGFPNGIEIDDDLIFTAGWSDGFAVRRLNNDGTLTKIYHDTYFLYRDTTSTYNHLQSVAIDKVNKKGVAMTYNVYGYTTFDYSGCVGGGTTFVKDARPTHTNPTDFIDPSGTNSRADGYVRRVGNSYTSGLAAAGEWIYAGEHDARHYKRIPRRNLRTGAQEFIGNSSGTGDLKSGSATIDRSGYRYTLFYDEVNDRMFCFPFYNGNFIVVYDASTANPELVWCDIADAGHGDDGQEQGLHIPDPSGAPNRMWIGGSGRILDIDITPCLTGSAPTVHNVIYMSNLDATAQNFRFGSKYQKTSGVPMDKVPGYSDMIHIQADRGLFESRGWIDTDNNHASAFSRRLDITEDTSTGGRGRSIDIDYGCPMILMESANGTKYWLQAGYSGSDGHKFHTYAESVKPMELIGNWEIVYGTYTLENSANIDMAFLGNIDKFNIPSSCSLAAFVSNDNGSTWETYDITSTTAHVFTTTGTQLRVKLSALGQPNKAPYYDGSSGDLNVSYSTLHSVAKDSNIKYKINRKRLTH